MWTSSRKYLSMVTCAYVVYTDDYSVRLRCGVSICRQKLCGVGVHNLRTKINCWAPRIRGGCMKPANNASQCLVDELSPIALPWFCFFLFRRYDELTQISSNTPSFIFHICSLVFFCVLCCVCMCTFVLRKHSLKLDSSCPFFFSSFFFFFFRRKRWRRTKAEESQSSAIPPAPQRAETLLTATVSRPY